MNEDKQASARDARSWPRRSRRRKPNFHSLRERGDINFLPAPVEAQQQSDVRAYWEFNRGTNCDARLCDRGRPGRSEWRRRLRERECADVTGFSDGLPKTRLYLSPTSFNRFFVSREINDGLLAPRFEPARMGAERVPDAGAARRTCLQFRKLPTSGEPQVPAGRVPHLSPHLFPRGARRAVARVLA